MVISVGSGLYPILKVASAVRETYDGWRKDEERCSGTTEDPFPTGYNPNSSVLPGLEDKTTLKFSLGVLP